MFFFMMHFNFTDLKRVNVCGACETPIDKKRDKVDLFAIPDFCGPDTKSTTPDKSEMGLGANNTPDAEKELVPVSLSDVGDHIKTPARSRKRQRRWGKTVEPGVWTPKLPKTRHLGKS
ncbi:unnamed protein product [Prorocentrum cordatum]|uniref:Uncharacterized protein n=1 Tax=Prorocentrum cordatum TaxID=2364126 RepID=A0ABN9R6Y4_9DINO|nr:unnamed protein product [Polarella glacialis]